MNVRAFRHAFIHLVFVVSAITIAIPVSGQEAHVNKKKIEKQQKKKEKKAQKEYEKAVKQHNKNQSPETKAMMKKNKREAGKKTPVKPSKGKKCK